MKIEEDIVVKMPPKSTRKMVMIEKENFNDLIEYLKHDSWRCDYYQECHCGLSDLTDKLGIPRIPFEGKYKEGRDNG